MKYSIKQHGQEYAFVSKQGVEFKPVVDQYKAMDNLKQLEEKLAALGFQCLQPRALKFDPSSFLKVTDESGRYVTLATYFSGSKETIRQKQSVAYDIAGLEKDVEEIIAELSKK